MKNNLLDVVFPRFCLGCGFVGVYICEACQKQMTKTTKQSCLYCRKRSLLGLTHPTCKQTYGIDGYLSLYAYNGLFKNVIQEVKYHYALEALKELLRFPYGETHRSLLQWKKLFNPSTLCVPLHSNRQRERGFNQSDIIANELFPHTSWVRLDCLKRTIDTTHLAHLTDKKERRSAIKGAFIYSTKGEVPKTILLIDDVVTSGSTIEECATTLKKHGVQTVLAFSLAKG